MDRFNGKKVRHAFLGMDVPIVDDIGDAIGDAASWVGDKALDAGKFLVAVGIGKDKSPIGWLINPISTGLDEIGLGFDKQAAVAGGILGSIYGGPIGGKAGSVIGSTLGSTVGKLAGSAVENAVEDKPAGPSSSISASPLANSNFGRSALLDQILAGEVARDPLAPWRGHEDGYAEGGTVASQPASSNSGLFGLTVQPAKLLTPDFMSMIGDLSRRGADLDYARTGFANAIRQRMSEQPIDFSNVYNLLGGSPTARSPAFASIPRVADYRTTPSPGVKAEDAVIAGSGNGQSGPTARPGPPGEPIAKAGPVSPDVTYTAPPGQVGGPIVGMGSIGTPVPSIQPTMAPLPSWIGSPLPAGMGMTQTNPLIQMPGGSQMQLFAPASTDMGTVAVPEGAQIFGGATGEDGTPTGRNYYLDNNGEPVWLDQYRNGELYIPDGGAAHGGLVGPRHFADGGLADLSTANQFLGSGANTINAITGMGGPNLSQAYSAAGSALNTAGQLGSFSGPNYSQANSALGAVQNNAGQLSNFQGADLGGAYGALGQTGQYANQLAANTGPNFSAANAALGQLGSYGSNLAGFQGPNYSAANQTLGTMGGYTSALGALQGPDYTAANQTLGLGSGLINDVLAASRGEGTSVAEALLQGQTDQNIRQIAGLTASQKGVSPAVAARLAAQSGGTMQQQAAQQGAALRAQEIAQARGLAGSLIGQQAGLQGNMAATTAGQRLAALQGAGALAGQAAGLQGNMATALSAQQLAGLQSAAQAAAQQAGIQSSNALGANAQQLQALQAAGALTAQQGATLGQLNLANSAQRLAGLQSAGQLNLGAANQYGNQASTASAQQLQGLLGAGSLQQSTANTLGTLGTSAYNSQLQGLLGAGSLANNLAGTATQGALGQGNLTLGQGNLYAQMAQAEAANQLGWGQLGANYDLGMGSLQNQNLNTWLNALGQYNATSAQGQNYANLANANLSSSLLGSGIQAGSAAFQKILDMIKAGGGGGIADGSAGPSAEDYANVYNPDVPQLNEAHGGEIPSFMQAIQEFGGVYHPPPFATGAFVPGRAHVMGDSERNDHVPAMLSPGEIVLPRSVVNAADAPAQAARFVAAIQRKKHARA